MSGRQMREAKWITSVLHSVIKRDKSDGKIDAYGCGCGVAPYIEMPREEKVVVKRQDGMRNKKLYDLDERV